MSGRPAGGRAPGPGSCRPHVGRADAGPVGSCRPLARVEANEPYGTMFRLKVSVPGWRGAMPGQFALLQTEHSRCFLARAFSVSDQVGDEVSFLIAPVGVATRELCSLRGGDRVWVLGPLGRGFDVDALVAGPGRAVLVGGGAGVAPFPLLLTRMLERYRALSLEPGEERTGSPGTADAEVLVLLGFRDDAQSGCALPVRDSVSRMGEGGVCCRLETAVEDGSSGPAEKVTDLLVRHLRPGDRVAVCGPDAMSTAVWTVCRAVADVRAWFSLETRMACGVGSCHGCSITLADGSRARVCRDGPVFRGEEVYGA